MNGNPDCTLLDDPALLAARAEARAELDEVAARYQELTDELDRRARATMEELAQPPTAPLTLMIMQADAALVLWGSWEAGASAGRAAPLVALVAPLVALVSGHTRARANRPHPRPTHPPVRRK